VEVLLTDKAAQSMDITLIRNVYPDCISYCRSALVSHTPHWLNAYCACVETGCKNKSKQSVELCVLRLDCRQGLIHLSCGFCRSTAACSYFAVSH